MVDSKKLGIGYIIISVFCGVLFAVVAVYFPAMMQQAFQQNPEGIQIDFWPDFLNALPLSLVIGFLLSPICYFCGRAAT